MKPARLLSFNHEIVTDEGELRHRMTIVVDMNVERWEENRVQYLKEIGKSGATDEELVAAIRSDFEQEVVEPENEAWEDVAPV